MYTIIIKILFLFDFNDFYFLILPIILLIHVYSIFFKINNNKTHNTNQNNLPNTIKLNSVQSLVGFGLMLCILNYIYIYTLRGRNSTILFNHLCFNNFNISLVYCCIFISFSIYFLIKIVSKKTNLIKSTDYLLSINNLVILLPYLFCVNTVFTFLFFLETVSVVLFYKLLSSKIWFKSTNNSISNNIPQNYINMVFFQYWVTFLSTIFIIYFYINMFLLFGTSDWFIIQYVNVFDFMYLSQSKSIQLYVFVFGVLLKLGIAPLHLFKVEVYNGLPYITIFFYTTFYFIVFFLYFFIFFYDFLFLFLYQILNVFAIFLFLGSLYTVILMFDVSFLKAFFAYSTIINSIGFIVAFFSLF